MVEETIKNLMASWHSGDVRISRRSDVPALESPAEPKPRIRLERAYGSGFNFPKPEPWA
jgi:hypothetical protein